jgi:hypothetical protein
MNESEPSRVPEWLIGTWNAVMYKRPAHPDEGILWPLRPRFALRVLRRLAP